MAKAKNLVPLKKRAEFLAVSAQGKKWVAPGFILLVAPRPLEKKKIGKNPCGDEGAARAALSGGPEVSPVSGFGLTASKKMVGIAVRRNRARRRLRALAYDFLGHHVGPGHNFVFIARADSLTRESVAMRQDIEKALKRFGLWRDSA